MYIHQIAMALSDSQSEELVGECSLANLTPMIASGQVNLEALKHSCNAENIDAPDQKGRTPLMLACWKGLDDVVEVLLEKGANPNIQSTGDGNTALHFACMAGRKVEEAQEDSFMVPSLKRLAILEVLMKGGAVLQNNKDGLNPPCLAASCGLTDILDYFARCSNADIATEDKIKAMEILGVSLTIVEDSRYNKHNYEKGHAAFCDALSFQQNHSSISETMASQDATHSFQTNLRECETLEDLQKAKDCKYATYAHAILVGERVLPKSMRNMSYYKCCIKLACDAMFIDKATDFGFQVFMYALHLESEGSVTLGSVLECLESHLAGCSQGDERPFSQVMDLICHYESVLGHVDIDQLLSECSDFVEKLSKFAFQAAFNLSHFPYVESSVHIIEKILSQLRNRIVHEGRECPASLSSIPYHMMWSLGDAFADNLYCGIDKKSLMQVKFVLCRVLFWVNPSYQDETYGDTVLHLLMNSVSICRDEQLIEDLAKAFVRHGCPLDTVNKEGLTALQVLENDDVIDISDEENKILIDIITPPTNPLELQELAARAILSNRISFRDTLPEVLFEFVEGDSSECKLKESVLEEVENVDD